MERELQNIVNLMTDGIPVVAGEGRRYKHRIVLDNKFILIAESTVMCCTYDRDKMLDLIQKVEVATQKGVILAGTKTALSAITKGMDAEWIANSQKEELATTGTILKNTGLGVEGIAIPQTFYRGSYDFKVDIFS